MWEYNPAELEAPYQILYEPNNPNESMENYNFSRASPVRVHGGGGGGGGVGGGAT